MMGLIDLRFRVRRLYREILNQAIYSWCIMNRKLSGKWVSWACRLPLVMFSISKWHRSKWRVRRICLVCMINSMSLICMHWGLFYWKWLRYCLSTKYMSMWRQGTEYRICVTKIKNFWHKSRTYTANSYRHLLSVCYKTDRKSKTVSTNTKTTHHNSQNCLSTSVKKYNGLHKNTKDWQHSRP